MSGLGRAVGDSAWWARLVVEVLERIVAQLGVARGEAVVAGDAAVVRAYDEVLAAVNDEVWSPWAARADGTDRSDVGVDGDLASEDRVEVDAGEVDVAAVAEYLQRIYRQLRAVYDDAKFGGDQIGREAYGEVLDVVVGIADRWWQTAERRRPVVEPDPATTRRVAEIIGEAFRRGAGLASPRERGLVDEDHRRRMVSVGEAAAEVAVFADFDRALLSAAHLEVLHQVDDRYGPVSTVAAVLGAASTMVAPGTRDGREVALVAEGYAALVGRARARGDRSAVERFLGEARAVLLGYTESELEGGIGEIPSGVVGSDDPAGTAASAVELIEQAMVTIGGLGDGGQPGQPAAD